MTPLSVSIPSIDAAQLEAARDAVVVDLRAPVEFARDHWPGAVNVPLFDDAQRALVGTLYRQVSPDAAFEAGREALAEHLTPFVRRLSECAGGAAPQSDAAQVLEELASRGIQALASGLVVVPTQPSERMLVLYCMRGGLRSRATAALALRLGFDRVAIVNGGYKAWRRAWVERIESWTPPQTFVLRGLTGVGKTLVLRELEALRPGSTLDLEDLAQHRSSVLGRVGLQPTTQKHFETLLAARLLNLRADALVVEGESRKVGDVIVPSSVWRAIDGGGDVEVCASLERRVQVLIDDYLAHPDSRAQLAPQLEFIEARLRKGGWDGSLVEMLNTGRERELVAILLERYYDPLYRHSEQGRRYVARLDAEDPRRAARELLDIVDARAARA